MTAVGVSPEVRAWEARQETVEHLPPAVAPAVESAPVPEVVEFTAPARSVPRGRRRRVWLSIVLCVLGAVLVSVTLAVGVPRLFAGVVGAALMAVCLLLNAAERLWVGESGG